MKKWIGLVVLIALVTACGGEGASNVPLTAVAWQSTPAQSGAVQEWQPPVPATRMPPPTTIPITPPSTVTPGATVMVPTAHMPMPSPVLPAFAFSPDDLVLINGLIVSDVLQVDTSAYTLVENTAPPLKLIPDSELVYGPAYRDFDIAAFVDQHNGFLETYRETVNGQILTGPQVVDYVARQYSVGPRVLLALLEYFGGWVTQPRPDWVGQAFPTGYVNPDWRGLSAQLTWAANHLNDGYYGWKYRGLRTIRFANDTHTLASRELNAGTIAVQTVLGLTTSYDVWKNSVSARGFLATYRTLFGDPFANDLGPPLPPDLQQPELILPWAADQVWNYTGGPHGGWGGGSAWAAVDFIPPDTRSGCYDSDEWVTAAAAGTVVRNAPGLVVVDLDDDGLEQTGWVINYLHMASRDWVAFVGARVRVGDWIGHPSCEGGIATGTHVHLARRYNGEWVPAGTPPVPLVLSGWQVVQGDSPYNGTMVKGDVTLTADTARSENNRVPH